LASKKDLEQSAEEKRVKDKTIDKYARIIITSRMKPDA
jgi:hypothetical protein